MPFLLQAFQTLKKRCSTNISTGLTMCLISLIVPVRGFVCAIVCVCTFCVCMCFKCVCVFCVCMCVRRYPALAQPRSDDQAGGAESGR